MKVTRFAPSPTGLLHVGNLRTAIFNFFVARKSNGKFILRFDDTDKSRSSVEFVDKIKEDLRWVGLGWDEEISQSDRLDRYDNAKKELIEMGRLYECFETKTEIELKRKMQLTMGRPPVYDRAALRLSEKEKAQLRAERRSYWRFKLEHELVEWEDSILGKQSIPTSSLSDPVLIRGDGQYLYTLASVMDDIDCKVTDIIRGSDHVTNTAVQIQLFKALADFVPDFSHHSLLVNFDGKALSKRDGSMDLEGLRKSGIEATAIVSLLISLGLSRAPALFDNFEDILANFELSHLSRAPAKLDIKSLQILSQKSLQRLSYHDVEKYILSIGVPKRLSESFWEMAKENISVRKDLEKLWNTCNRNIILNSSEPDHDFLQNAFLILKDLSLSDDIWRLWTEKVKKVSGRKGKELYQPLRHALTGQNSGPDMNKLLPIMVSNGLKLTE